MTQNKPHLFLSRLVVVSNYGTVVYDNTFHKGVNIIRGQNSSGKSTIANFIFYALGGDFTNWSKAALQCSHVYAELKLNGAVVTTRRSISQNSQQPMAIYWGGYELAKDDSLSWQIFPYRQTESRLSFSNILFNALDFPEVKTDLDNTITIHQILRLHYVDQDTPAQSLFRIEKFDPPLTRTTVAEILLGLYDDSLYANRVEIRDAQKQLDNKRSEYDAINKILRQSGENLTIGTIRSNIDIEQRRIAQLDIEIQQLKRDAIVKTTKSTALGIEKIQSELSPLKEKIATISEEIDRYQFDIYDSQQFIDTLRTRVRELDFTLLTKKVLGELPLTHCPQCLTKLSDTVAEGHCTLCKEVLPEESEKSQAARLKQEMEIQIKESLTLLEAKERWLLELKSTLQAHVEDARRLQRNLDIAVKDSQSTRDDRIDILFVEKGAAEKQIEILSRQLKTAELLVQLLAEIDEISGRVTHLRNAIDRAVNEQNARTDRALERIKNYTLGMLRNDLDRQPEFKTGKNVEIYFSKDTFSLDGSNNFSASSKTYFKNSLLFSIFFASLELDFMRYPRFILCDNIEDKGMEKERSQHFQKLIALMSESSIEDHQIIFTTSMIADELNGTDLCVGDFYNDVNKTLDLNVYVSNLEEQPQIAI